MKKNLLTLGVIGLFTSVNAQSFSGTFIGAGGQVTVLDNTFVTNNGSLKVAASGKGLVMGDFVVNHATTGDAIEFLGDADFRLQYLNATTYGQLYVKDYDAANISGSVTKEYSAEYNNGAGGTQQIGLPFQNYTGANLESTLGSGWMNLTNSSQTSSGRFSKASAFVWSDSQARFNQVLNSTVISPLKYYVLPTFSATGTVASWVPNGPKKDFKGKPAADLNFSKFVLKGAFNGSFGVNGNGVNYFRERYNSYIDDPFETKSAATWATTYGKNLYQLSNPYLTNLDMSDLTITGADITKIDAIGYYEGGAVNYTNGSGTSYQLASTRIVKYTNGIGNAGDVSKMVIKPMGAFMIKLKGTTGNTDGGTLDLDKLRSFSQAPRTTGNTGVHGKGLTSALPADKIVKQVAVVLHEPNGSEVGRTYFAVSPSAITGVYEELGLQAYVNKDIIFTKEEKIDGGEDPSIDKKLYINEANEVEYQGKEVPMFVNFNEAGSYLTFETYEGGQLVDTFSNGKSFYIKKDNVLTKLDNTVNMPLDSNFYGLYFEKPAGTLGSTDLSKSNTIVARKSSEWVVRFAKDWSNANVEVYSAAGQLVHSKKGINTASDYTLPLDSKVRGIYLVKVTSDKGQEVVKKIVQ